jgi:hypothetical protein
MFEELGSVNEEDLFGGKIHVGYPASITSKKSEHSLLTFRLPATKCSFGALQWSIVDPTPPLASAMSQRLAYVTLRKDARGEFRAAPRPKRPVEIRSDSDSSGLVTDIGQEIFPTAAF